jgi:hypothetical protein
MRFPANNCYTLFATICLLALLIGITKLQATEALGAAETRPLVDDVVARPLRQLGPTIVGGEDAVLDAWPWMVALVDAATPNARDGQFCGGSLIHAEWVLTAAHCTYRNGLPLPPAQIDVVIGRHQLSSNEGRRVAVDQLIRHPNHSLVTRDYDVALLQLAAPVNQPPIRLLRDDQPTLDDEGQLTTILGWGLTSAGNGNSAADALQQVSVPVVSNHTCTYSYGLFAGRITPQMKCAGYRDGGYDACQGDSGGPQMLFDPLNNEWVQIGVVSWGYGCAAPFYYGVYARLSPLAAWIDSQTPDLRQPQVTPPPTPMPAPTMIPMPTPTALPGGLSATLHLPLIYFDTRLPVINGDFEQGADHGWQMHTLFTERNIWNHEELGANPTAHSGHMLARLGNANNEVSVIDQYITVPPDRPRLTFWRQIRSDDFCGYDVGGVVVNDQIVVRFNLCTLENQTTWREQVVDLSAYAGELVLLQIRVETNGSRPSSLFLDDVAWQAADREVQSMPGGSAIELD